MTKVSNEIWDWANSLSYSNMEWLMFCIADDLHYLTTEQTKAIIWLASTRLDKSQF